MKSMGMFKKRRRCRNNLKEALFMIKPDKLNPESSFSLFQSTAAPRLS
jgi:hypothetical protein